MSMRRVWSAIRLHSIWRPALALLLVAGLHAGDTPWLGHVRAYADAMLAHGRDEYGSASPLFAACLMRDPIVLPDERQRRELLAIPVEAWGVRSHDRCLTGANPHHDQSLYLVLYALSDCTGEPRYGKAADAALAHFWHTAQSPATGLMAWGEHMGWDLLADRRTSQEPHADGIHEFNAPWLLWEPTWRLAPEPAARFATGLWQHQIAEHATGDFSRHALYDRHGPGRGSQYPRHAGFYLATWAEAWRRTRDPEMLTAMRVLLAGIVGRRHPRTGALIAETAERTGGNAVWLASELSLAIDAWAAAEGLPADLADGLRAQARQTDRTFAALDHAVPRRRGFISHIQADTLRQTETMHRAGLPAETSPWGGSYGETNTAGFGMLCLLRAAQGGDARLRDLGLEAAAVYHDLPVDGARALWPRAIARVIRLQLEAWRTSSDRRHLGCAERLAAEAVRLFLAGSPLPAATSSHGHYEAITGGPELMAALLALHWATARPDEVPPLPYTAR